jgi:DNA repair protein RecO
MIKTYSAEGIVLKRSNLGEADRLVTIFTKEYGKVVAVAKGVRRITSSRAATIEPATQANFFFAVGKTIDILTQSNLICSFTHARDNLTRVTQTYQILEIVDLLTVEQQDHPEVYAILLDTLCSLESRGHKKAYLLENIRLILKALGFTWDKKFSEEKLKDYIEDLANKRLRSKAYLTLKP